MSEQTIHPSPEELSAFSLGQLPRDAAVAVESHISECQPCCNTLLGLSSDDTFVGLLQEADQLPPDQTVAGDLSALQSTSSQDVPAPLAEHPRYEIIRLIGKGGMGDVYEAIHRKMERRVALKVINRDLFQKAEAVNRFHREVKTAAQLSHPNIVTSHDADQAGDFHFMVMEFVDGVDLSRIVKDKGALPVADACDYIRQAAMGLQHAHERGMVHRDIKPHNLMITSNGAVKILDFGLASFAPEVVADADTVEARGDLTAAGSMMGTPDFISPEQANDARRADIRSDIYSLGATLYFLLAGRPPFAEGSVMHKLKSHAQVDAEPLESVRGDIPVELASVVSKMTAKNPDDRFQTPLEVAAALEPYVQPPQSEQVESPRLQVQPRRSRISLFTAVATLLVAAIVAAAVFYIQTDNGTVRVKVLDESLAVKFSDQTIRVDDGNKEFTIGAGKEKKLIVTQDGSDFELVTNSFQIRRNDEVALEVDIVDGKVVVTKDEEPFGNKELEPMPPLIAEKLTKKSAETSSNDRGDKTPADHKAEDQGVLAFLYEGNPDLTQRSVKHYIDRGDYERAKQILSSVQQADPKATAALKIAKIQEEKGEIEKAADSTLEAIRLTPWLLSDKQLPLIKKAGRVPQLVEVLTEERLLNLGYNNYLKEVVNALLNDEATRADGLDLLVRVSVTHPHTYRRVVGSLPQKLLSEDLDPAPFLRKNLIPTDFSAERAGWERFDIDSYVSDLSNNYSLRTRLEKLSPVIQGNLRKNAALNAVAREVENKLEQHPAWKAGVAVLGYLQAELGNEQQAVALFEQVLAEKDSPMPPRVAWIFGLVLEGKGKALDQMVMRLYERKITGPVIAPGRRYEPIKDLADLYAWYGRRNEVRELLFVLAEPEPEVRCTPGWQVQNEDASCVKCHKTDRSYKNFTLLSSKLSDLGYPVDAYLQLARIDASFHHIPSSDEEWVNQNADKFIYRQSSVGDIRNGSFQKANNKAVKGITPQALLNALESGVFLDSDRKQPVIAASAARIDLMLGVRGENGKSTLFSPVIEMLEIAAKAKGDKAAIANVRIDQLLAEAFDKNPDNVEAGIAATVFAFLRNDLDAAMERLQRLQDHLQAHPKSRTPALWLVARLALQNERTRMRGQKLAEQALIAADSFPDSAWKQVILRERLTIESD